MSWLPSSVDQQLSLWTLRGSHGSSCVRSGRNLGQSMATGAGIRGEQGEQEGPCHGLERSVSRLGLKGQL